MRLTGQIRRDNNIATPAPINSTYKPITRAPRRFNALRIPAKLQATLPYASKPKQMVKQREGKTTYMAKRAVVMEPEDKKALALLQQMRAVRKEQVVKRKEKKREKLAERVKKVQREAEKKGEKDKERKKEVMRMIGQKSKREEEESAGGGKRRRTKKA